MTTNPKRRGRIRNSIIAGALTLVLVAGGGAVWAADRFLIEHVEISDVSAYEADSQDTSATDAADGTDAGLP